MPFQKIQLSLNSSKKRGKPEEKKRNISDKFLEIYVKQKRDSMIVVIGGIKGGCGKTTLTINLAAILASKGKKVLIVDTDKQESTYDVAILRKTLKVPTPWSIIKLTGITTGDELFKMKEDYDEIIVDGGAGDTDSQRGAIGVANILISPFNPSHLDMNTITKLRIMVTACLPINRKLKVLGLINRADSRGTKNQQGIDLLKRQSFISPMKTIIKNRVSFRDSFDDGLSLIEMKQKDPKAVNEIMNLYKEIYREDDGKEK
jgi:chromosome partitioning protein